MKCGFGENLRNLSDQKFQGKLKRQLGRKVVGAHCAFRFQKIPVAALWVLRGMSKLDE